MSYTVHTVGVHGGDGFLIVDGNNSVLVDCGFAWAAPKLLDDVRGILGTEGAPDWLVLTHSHYDHCSAMAYLREHMPTMQVAASKYAGHVFKRPGAWETMRKLNAVSAQEHGLSEFIDVPNRFVLDRVLGPEDMIDAGNLHFTVLPAAGHTKCSIALWEPEQKLLACCESAGVYSGEFATRILPDGTSVPEDVPYLVGPACLVGHDLSLDFIARARSLGAQAMISPHYGLIEGASRVNEFFTAADFFHLYAVRRICELYKNGLSEEEICSKFLEFFYTQVVADFQPRAAFELNATIMVHRVLVDCGYVEPSSTL
ncbi:MAG: MBL fold metallo-hydrolase [Coriobacteriales bacterium]|nr:MBL fold metallo-hydrolase [Coriobacteriales bacterium]